MVDSKKTSARARLMRVAMVALTAMMLAFGAVALSGCGGSDEDAIKKDLTSQLDLVKNQDSQVITSFTKGFTEAANADTSGLLTSMGLDGASFAKALLSGYDYQVGDIKVNGDKATAQVTMTCKDLSGLKTTLETELNNLMADPSVSSMSQADLLKKFGSMILSSIEKAPTVKQDPVTVSYVKKDGKWQLSDTTGTELLKPVIDGINKALS